MARTGTEKAEAGWPTSMAIACSVLGPGDPAVDRGRLRGPEGRLRLDERDLVIDARVITGLFGVQGLLVGLHGVVEHLLQGVLAADLEEVLREAGLLGQTFKRQVGRAELGGELAGAHGVANLPPEIGRPRNLSREREHLGLQVGGHPRRGRCEIGGAPGPGERRGDADGREELRPRLPHQRARLHVVLEGHPDVLVVDLELRFERVQLRFPVDLPPCAAVRPVLWLRGVPADTAPGRDGSLLEGRRRRHRGGDVGRPDVAPRETQAKHRDREPGWECESVWHDRPLHGSGQPPPAVPGWKAAGCFLRKRRRMLSKNR